MCLLAALQAQSNYFLFDLAVTHSHNEVKHSCQTVSTNLFLSISTKAKYPTAGCHCIKPEMQQSCGVFVPRDVRQMRVRALVLGILSVENK